MTDDEEEESTPWNGEGEAEKKMRKAGMKIAKKLPTHKHTHAHITTNTRIHTLHKKHTAQKKTELFNDMPSDTTQKLK